MRVVVDRRELEHACGTRPRPRSSGGSGSRRSRAPRGSRPCPARAASPSRARRSPARPCPPAGAGGRAGRGCRSTRSRCPRYPVKRTGEPPEGGRASGARGARGSRVAEGEPAAHRVQEQAELATCGASAAGIGAAEARGGRGRDERAGLDAELAPDDLAELVQGRATRHFDSLVDEKRTSSSRQAAAARRGSRCRLRSSRAPAFADTMPPTATAAARRRSNTARRRSPPLPPALSAGTPAAARACGRVSPFWRLSLYATAPEPRPPPRRLRRPRRTALSPAPGDRVVAGEGRAPREPGSRQASGRTEASRIP